jgi:translation initiation factor 4E
MLTEDNVTPPGTITDSDLQRNETTTEERDKSVSLTPIGFADPRDFTIKHPLQNRWTMWYDNPRKKTTQDTWGSHLRKIVEFDTVSIDSGVFPCSLLFISS